MQQIGTILLVISASSGTDICHRMAEKTTPLLSISFDENGMAKLFLVLAIVPCFEAHFSSPDKLDSSKKLSARDGYSYESMETSS